MNERERLEAVADAHAYSVRAGRCACGYVTPAFRPFDAHRRHLARAVAAVSDERLRETEYVIAQVAELIDVVDPAHLPDAVAEALKIIDGARP